VVRSREVLTQGFIDVALYCGMFAIRCPELAHYVGLVQVTINNVDDSYGKEDKSTTSLQRVSHSHCESSTDAPTRRDRILFVVRSTEAIFTNRLATVGRFCFLAFAENNDWTVPTRPEKVRCNTVNTVQFCRKYRKYRMSHPSTDIRKNDVGLNALLKILDVLFDTFL
jgi:hypothetical protein